MVDQTNRKCITFYELLKIASEKEDKVSWFKENMKYDPRIFTVLGYALNPNFKMPLPDGMPPYIPSNHVLGVSPLEILTTHNKMYIMYNRETKRHQKESIYVQWLEDMAPEEAELMIRIKDQTLPEAFDGKITINDYLQIMGWSKEVYQTLISKRS